MDNRPTPAARSISHYEILAPLGKGGMGEVFVAFDTTLQRKVALKAVRRDRLDDESRARLLREARILSQLDHPGICRVHDYVSDGGSDYLVLELIDGTSLRDAMAPLDYAAKLRIAEQIASALTAAHAAGIVHRDLKPDNVMLLPDPSTGSGRGGSAKVLDFGLARSFDAPLPPGAGAGVRMAPAIGSQFDSATETMPAGRSSGVADTGVQTVHGLLLGTPAYMAPEQAAGEPATAPSDMYAFGLLLQELFTGIPPYDLTTDLPTLLDQVRRGDARDIVGVPRDLGDLVTELKSVAPSRRPTAVDAVARLRRIRDKPARRVRYAIAAALIVLAVAGAVKYTVDLAHERNAAVLAQQDADRRRNQAEELIGFMLGDLRPRLARAGRLEDLNVVGEKAMQYFASVPPDSLSDQELFRRSQAIHQLGQVRKLQGDLKAAGALSQQSLDLMATIAARDPANAEWQVGLATSHYYVGEALLLQGDLDGALREMTEYRDIAAGLVTRDPQKPEWLLELSYGHNNVGGVMEAKGDLDAALREFTLTLDMKRRVAAAKPGHRESEEAVANAHNRIGLVLEKQGNGRGALEHYRQDFAIRERLATKSVKDTTAQKRLADAASYIGRISHDHGDDATAREYYSRRLAILEALVTLDPANAEWQRERATADIRMAGVDRLAGDARAAVARAQRAVAVLRPLAEKDASNIRRQRDAADGDVELASALLQAGQTNAALTEASRASSALERILAKNPKDLDARRLLADAYLISAAATRARAGEFIERARATLEPVAATVEERRLQKTWALVLRRLGRSGEADAVAARLRESGFRPFTP